MDSGKAQKLIHWIVSDEMMRSLVKHPLHRQRWRNRTLFLCLWFAGVLVFWGVYYTWHTFLVDPWRVAGIEEADADKIAEAIKNLKLNNETGSFAFSKVDGDRDFRPLYAIDCGNLMGAKGQVGVFKTSAFKIAEIQDLTLRLYSYSDSPGDSKGYLSRRREGVEDKLSMPVSSNKNQVFRQLMSVVSKDGVGGLEDTVKDSSLWIDLGNLAGLKITNFDCTFIHDANEVLAMSCRTAEVSGENEIVFRGRVVLQAGKVNVLRSNHVIWRVRDERFHVPDRYMLTQGADTRVGQESWFSEQLLAMDH